MSITGLVINRMAALNLLAVSNVSARTVPLLRGCVLATGQRGGRPHRLTREHTRAFRVEGDPVWWVNSAMSVRGGARSVAAPAPQLAMAGSTSGSMEEAWR